MTFKSIISSTSSTIHDSFPKRDATSDIAKAIGILLMILGHCNGIPFIVRNFIFSFHMPLFFILSGFFFKPKPIREIALSGSRHLVRPYLITAAICILLCLTAEDITGAKNKIIGTIMSNGGWPSEKFGRTLPFIGPIWFLLALFWCKIFYAYLKRKTRNIFLWCLIISTTALLIGKYILNLPFGILTGFCGLIFYWMGDYWKNRLVNPINKYILCFGLIIWLGCIWKSHLELATFDCSLYPISMLAAFVGTYMIYLLSMKIPSKLQPLFIWIGQNTLLILCYHTLYFFIYGNIKHHFLQPNGIVLSEITIGIICFTISLGFPVLHKYVYKRITNSTTSIYPPPTT